MTPIPLTCAELHLAGVRGVRFHRPDELDRYGDFCDCGCGSHDRDKTGAYFNECARQETVTVGRFRLTLCCSCASRWYFAVAQHYGYKPSELLEWGRQPDTVHRHAARDLMASVVWTLRRTEGRVGTWEAFAFRGNRAKWAKRIAAERREAA